jgi:MYXO-CTERM domain-containing protein
MREDNVKHSTSSKSLGRGISALALILGTMSASEVLAAPLAFPGAEGFAAMVTGGRKGQVYHVTTLADSGAGSLRDAVSQGNRIVVFDISGVINPTNVIVVAGDNITLAGQSAPGDGITIYGRETSFSSRSNIIVRYLRFRQGMTDTSGSAKKTVNITDGQNMIFDHVSIQWGRWDNFGITGTSSTITLQNSIVGEGVPPQNFGSIIDGEQDITIAHNLWIDNNERNPKFKANGECINNVVYNWGTGGGIIGGHSGTPWYEDYIGNYLIAGPSAVDKFFTFYTDTDHAYQTGNMVDVNKDGQLNGRAVVNADFQGTSPPTFETAAHSKPPVPVTVLSAEDAYARVVAQAGTCKHRDAVELRLIAQLSSLGTKGAIIADESTVGGQPAVTSEKRPAGFDTDNDGMSDAWETAHGLNPSSASDATGDYNGDGYTNIEKYLNSLADDACGGSSPTNPPDASTAPLNDAAAPTADASVPPGKDAATSPSPDAGSPTSDTATVRTDAFVPGSDTATLRPDAGSSTTDGPVVLADAASPASDAPAMRPDAAVSSPDVAATLADAAPPLASDVAPVKTDSNFVASPDTAPGNTQDAAATNPKATPPSPSGCSCAMGATHSSNHLGLFSLLAAALLVGRSRILRRRKAAGNPK